MEKKRLFRGLLAGLSVMLTLGGPHTASASGANLDNVLDAPDGTEVVIVEASHYLNGSEELDLSEQAIYDRMIALKEDYPEGMPWTNANFYAWNGGIYSGGGGCAGFAFLLSDAGFGDLPARILDDLTYDAIRVGDILRMNNDSHSVVVLQKYDTYVVLAEGNYNSSIHWGRTVSKSSLESGDLTYIMTRYPSDPIEHTYEVVSRDGKNVKVKCTHCGKTKEIVCPQSVKRYIKSGQSYHWSSAYDTQGVQVDAGSSLAYMIYPESGSTDVIVAEIKDPSIACFSNGSGVYEGEQGVIYGKKAGSTVMNIRSKFGESPSLATIKIVVKGQDVELTGTVSISGELKYGSVLTAALTDGNATGALRYQWMRDGAQIAGATKETYQLAKEDIGKTIGCAVSCDGQTGELTGKTNGKIGKADAAGLPAGIVGVQATNATTKDGKIVGVNNKLEYATQSDSEKWEKCTGSEVTGLAAGAYYVRVAETETTAAGSPVKVIVRDGSAELIYQDMYRLYNPNSGEHFYTANAAERDFLASVGWNYEGLAWKAPETSSVPVYRLYNPNAGDHHYTTNAEERNMLIGIGWNDEGIGWYSDEAEGEPLYRLYNPNATQAGAHHYTTNAAERDMLVSIGWRDEGIGWYGGK